ncbi:MAG: family 10 glycosylhydrolase [Spirosomataceae bacterium]
MPFYKIIGLLVLLSCSLFAQPKREFRGVWIANVGNVDWPSTKGLSAEQQQEELVALLDMIQQQGLNAVFFQVRNACDAVYESQLEPWSEWLTGQQGQSPGYDPLAFVIQECRKRNLEIHAWMNPYRAVTDIRTASIASNHVARVRPDVLLSYGPLRMLDPGLPEVRVFVSRVVMDIVRRYDIDGIHFDDYFYPYPQLGVTLNDNTTFKTHGRGFTNRADWRRDNVNLLIEAVADSIHRTKPWVKFGVSPFGIWQNRSSSSEGSNSRGFEAYSGNYADSRKWVQEGWVDYIAPQVYWSMGNSGSANYTNIVPWWSENVSEQHLYIGQGVYKVNSDSYWRRPLEVSNQIKYNRTFSNVHGSILFSAKTLRNNPNRVRNTLLENVYQTTALIPTMPWKNTLSPATPSPLKVQLNDDNTVTLTWSYPTSLTSEREKARYFVLYRSVGNSPIDLRTGQCIRATIVNNEGKTTFSYTDHDVASGCSTITP